MRNSMALLLLLPGFFSCRPRVTTGNDTSDKATVVMPAVVTEKVYEDSDDPAIWIDQRNPAASLIIGTDKHKDNGGLYVFTLDGKIDRQRSVLGLKRMNNVDVAYGLKGGDSPVDIAVATERDRNMIRVFQLPAMKPIDGGGLEVFVGDSLRSPMGIALYTRPADHAVFAIVGRKSGPATGYLAQYQLFYDGKSAVRIQLVRRFGRYSGKKEIESIAVDNRLGFVYYSDEQFGIRKYFADPARGDEELAVFGQGEFREDNEGISIYELDDQTGYILVSDQAADHFNVYAREGSAGDVNKHVLLTRLPVHTRESDGSDVTSTSLPGFPGGLFVAMSTDSTFQLYRWRDLAGKGRLKERSK